MKSSHLKRTYTWRFKHSISSMLFILTSNTISFSELFNIIRRCIPSCLQKLFKQRLQWLISKDTDVAICRVFFNDMKIQPMKWFVLTVRCHGWVSKSTNIRHIGCAEAYRSPSNLTPLQRSTNGFVLSLWKNNFYVPYVIRSELRHLYGAIAFALT